MTSARGHYEERLWEARPGGMGGRRDRRAFRYRAFVPEPIAAWDMDLRADTVTAMTEATSAVARLNDSPPALESLEALARHLLRAESLASSRIEGLELSHRRLARATLSRGEDRDPEASEVVGNVAAMERAVEIGARATTFQVADVQAIHETLMRFALDRHIAGVIRDKQSWIGLNPYTPRNADYVPPPPEYVDDLLGDLCTFMNRDDLPTLVQAAVVHGQFETIHPFGDGNGRVGRCLIHAVLERRGLASRYVPPISLALAASRDRYIQGLEDFRAGRVNEWIEAFSYATRHAASAAERLAVEIRELRERWVERLGRPRRDSSVHTILSALPAHPVIDVPTAREIAGISDVAAGRALASMEEADILVNIGGRQRSRAWECRELFDVVDGFERDLGGPSP